MAIATQVADEPMDGFGSVLQVDMANDGTFVTIPGIESIPEIGVEVNAKENTPVGADYATYHAGRKANKSFDVVMNSLPADADQIAFLQLVEGRQTRPTKVIYANGAIRSFDCCWLFTHFGEAGKDDTLMVAVGGQPTGEITLGTVA